MNSIYDSNTRLWITLESTITVDFLKKNLIIFASILREIGRCRRSREITFFYMF